MSSLDDQLEQYSITNQVAREARQMLRETRAIERSSKALRDALEEIERICRDTSGQGTDYAYTVGRVASIARNALKGEG